MSKEYTLIKDITASEIYNAAESKFGCFRQEFQQFLYWADEHYKGRGQDQFYFFEYVDLIALQREFEKHPVWAKFLIEHGFIKEKFVAYKAGDKFKYTSSPSGYKHMLAVVGYNLITMITEDGCLHYGAPPIQVANASKITEQEFRLITRDHPEYFTKIEEEQK